MNKAIGIYSIVVIYAIFFMIPPAEGLGELVRIAFFHIPFAWLSVLAFLLSAWWGWSYLRTKDMHYDALSCRSAVLGFIAVLLATVSGAIFSKLTWGAYWNWDPRQTTIFVLILIYGAYLTLRYSIPQFRKRANVAAVYSLLSFVTVPFLVFIIPRAYFSLHPETVINAAGRIDMEPLMLIVLIGALADVTLIFFRLLYYRLAEAEK